MGKAETHNGLTWYMVNKYYPRSYSQTYNGFQYRRENNLSVWKPAKPWPHINARRKAWKQNRIRCINDKSWLRTNGVPNDQTETMKGKIAKKKVAKKKVTKKKLLLVGPDQPDENKLINGLSLADVLKWYPRNTGHFNSGFESKKRVTGEWTDCCGMYSEDAITRSWLEERIRLKKGMVMTNDGPKDAKENEKANTKESPFSIEKMIALINPQRIIEI